MTITKGVIRQQALLVDSSKKDSSNQDKSAYKLVRPGDITYNKMRAWQGAVGVSDYQGIVSPAYVVERPRDGTDSRYLHYLLRTPAFSKEAERWSYGITSDMWSLRPEHFKMIYGCLPPLPEQAAIVRFLDHADRRIRRHIRAQQQLIALLEEQKQAIIHQAVTGQIDVRTGKPYQAYKDSRVDWLGEVPEHWALDRIKRSTIGCKNGVWGDEAKEDDNDIPCVRVADFDRQRLRVELSDPTIRNVTQNERTGRVLRRGDLLLEKSGGGELQPVGCVVLYDDRQAVCSNFVARMLIAPGMSSSFWRYFHAAAYAVRLNTRSIKQTTGIQNLDQQQYFDERAVFHPSDEQIQIATFLDHADQRIRRYIRAKQQLIALLEEQKQAIIHQAVTGQIDVREAAARLPDAVEDPEPFDETSALIDGEEEPLDDLDAVPEDAEV